MKIFANSGPSGRPSALPRDPHRPSLYLRDGRPGPSPSRENAPPSGAIPESREANLPAQRAPPQAPARVPRAHADARRPGDPQAAAGEGPEAPLRLTSLAAVKRRHRLSRSRDFDAVYRKGRSVSTRYLVVYAFPARKWTGSRTRASGSRCRARSAARSPRNRLKRQLRAAADALDAGLEPGHDYVVAARPGLSEAAESQGGDWLRERLGEALRLADHAERKATA